MYEVRFHGRGGQGAVTAANILAMAAFKEGKDVQAFPIFGVERRGAPVAAFMRMDEKPIDIKTQIYEPDAIVVLDPTLLEVVDVAKGLKTGGIIILNTTKGPNDFEFGDAKCFTVDATSIAVANHLGTKTNPIVNTAILGAFSKAAGNVGMDAIRMDDARNRQAILDLAVADAVSPRHDRPGCHHALRSAAKNLAKNLGRKILVGKADDVERGEWFCAHCVDVGEAVGRGDPAEGVWIVHQGGKEIERRDQRGRFVELVDPGVVEVVHPDKQLGIPHPRQFAQHLCGRPHGELARSPGTGGIARQANLSTFRHDGGECTGFGVARHGRLAALGRRMDPPRPVTGPLSAGSSQNGGGTDAVLWTEVNGLLRMAERGRRRKPPAGPA